MNSNTALQKVPANAGIGLLEISTRVSIPLFKNSDDQTPFDLITFKKDKSGRTVIHSKVLLVPYQWSEGESDEGVKKNIRRGITSSSSLLRFRVIHFDDQSFEVVINEKTHDVCFIKTKAFAEYNHIAPGDSAAIKYEQWSDFLKNAEFITKKHLKIYDKPEGAIIFENNAEKFLPFSVVEVSGYWIRLKKASGREFNFDDIINYDGWTQWRTKDSILVNITEFTIE